MKDFRFRLDPLLGLRRYEMERAAAALAEAERVAAGARRRRDEWTRRMRLGAEALDARLVGGLSAGEYRLGVGALGTVNLQRGDADEAVSSAEQRVGVLRAEVLAARTRLRSLELLRERAEQVHRRRQEAREQRDLDEVAARIVAMRTRQ